MLKRFFLTSLATALAVSIGYAQSNTSTPAKVNKTDPTNGKQMFVNYCASCHGVNGKGNGPAAAALKIPPADLTLLSKSNNGKFPETHVVAVLQFGPAIPPHGSAEMPIWGPILGRMEKANPDAKQIRISNLVQYLKTIQVN